MVLNVPKPWFAIDDSETVEIGQFALHETRLHHFLGGKNFSLQLPIGIITEQISVVGRYVREVKGRGVPQLERLFDFFWSVKEGFIVGGPFQTICKKLMTTQAYYV